MISVKVIAEGAHNCSAGLRLLFVILIGLTFALAPALSNHPAEILDQSIASATQNAAGGADGVVIHPERNGLACHATGACVSAAILPEAAELRVADHRQIHVRLASPIRSTLPVTPDNRPPIA